MMESVIRRIASAFSVSPAEQIVRVNRGLKRAKNAPYQRSEYDQLLKSISRKNIEIVPFIKEMAKVGQRSQVYVRHDVDFDLCVQQLPILLDIDLANSIPAAVFLRVDDADYSCEELTEVVSQYRDVGIEFGLHSTCYLSDDYFDAFDNELEKFAKTFGFRARTMTVHGLGNHRLDKRLQFSRKISERMEDFGIESTDCSEAGRIYNHVIQDCTLDSLTGERFALDDLFQFPKLPARGHNYLILTHPCYWN